MNTLRLTVSVGFSLQSSVPLLCFSRGKRPESSQSSLKQPRSCRQHADAVESAESMVGNLKYPVPLERSNGDELSSPLPNMAQQQQQREEVEQQDLQVQELSALELYHLNVASRKTEYTLTGDARKGPKDKRSRRIASSGIFTAGVAIYRSKLQAANGGAILSSLASASRTRVLTRPRPLFQHEAEAGEWDSVTRLPQGGVALHEGTEQLRSNKGLTKMLRHHTYRAVHAVSTDAELYDAVSPQLKQATRGKMSTVFFYGMTGSGKTYSMDALHKKLPSDLFALLAADEEGGGATVRFHAFELVGKRCFDLADGKAEQKEKVGKGEEKVGEDGTKDGGEGEGKVAAAAAKTEVFLRVDHHGATEMRGMKEHEVDDADALLNCLRDAVARRETSATGANATSSRSHAVYVLVLPGGGRLTMIDLAGSEAAQETLYHTKQHMAQSKEINNS